MAKHSEVSAGRFLKFRCTASSLVGVVFPCLIRLSVYPGKSLLKNGHSCQKKIALILLLQVWGLAYIRGATISFEMTFGEKHFFVNDKYAIFLQGRFDS